MAMRPGKSNASTWRHLILPQPYHQATRIRDAHNTNAAVDWDVGQLRSLDMGLAWQTTLFCGRCNLGEGLAHINKPGVESCLPHRVELHDDIDPL